MSDPNQDWGAPDARKIPEGWDDPSVMDPDVLVANYCYWNRHLAFEPDAVNERERARMEDLYDEMIARMREPMSELDALRDRLSDRD